MRLGFQQYAADPDSDSNSHAVAQPRTLADSGPITKPDSHGRLRCISLDLVLHCRQKSSA